VRRDRNGLERASLTRLFTRTERPSAIVERAVLVMQRGGTIVFPTDTVYGIGCDPLSEEGVAQIYRLKRRPANKALSLHFGTVEELLEYAAGNTLAAELARAFVPGAITIVVRRPGFVPDWVTGGLPTLGLRVPKHRLCATMLNRCGPLAATSANASGSPAYAGEGPLPPEVEGADLLIDDGPTALRIESTVVDVSQGEVRIVREGAIRKDMLDDVLGVRSTAADAAGRG